MKYNETLMNEVSSHEMFMIEGGSDIFDHWKKKIRKFLR